MKLRSMEFEISAVRPEQWPEGGLPEFAFLGRSNVGKSSLLNRLLNRKSFARVSQNPGKTQQINFFRINDELRFVDLPGYGYASVSKTERAKFLKMMGTYLENREPLQRIFHLIDIRHNPTKDDLMMHEAFLKLGVPITVIATKLDKLSKSQVKPNADKIRKGLQTPYAVLPVSSAKAVNIDALWNVIETDLEQLVADEDDTEPS